jgi:hypothetical protein
MKNQRYVVGDEDIIVSSEEHEKIKKIIENHGGMVYLRDGKMAINTSFIKSVHETETPTDAQIEDGKKRLRLEEAQMSGKESDFIKRTKVAFYEKMGWGIKNETV